MMFILHTKYTYNPLVSQTMYSYGSLIWQESLTTASESFLLKYKTPGKIQTFSVPSQKYNKKLFFFKNYYEQWETKTNSCEWVYMMAWLSTHLLYFTQGDPNILYCHTTPEKCMVVSKLVWFIQVM